ncbi:MAG TPA: proteasome activator [Microthrixaceae bacterium]|nr:proteasome activator [Microthrixaceae bacterium]
MVDLNESSSASNSDGATRAVFPEVISPTAGTQGVDAGGAAGGGNSRLGGGAGDATDAHEMTADSEANSDVLSPAKIIRIGAMLKQLLEEVRSTPVDAAARGQLSEIYNSSIKELKSALSPDLGQELDALSFDFDGEVLPTEAELRLAQAQLVGWLEGLFHGIQAMMVAQQMAARQQLEGLRAELSERTGGPTVPGPGYI